MEGSTLKLTVVFTALGFDRQGQLICEDDSWSPFSFFFPLSVILSKKGMMLFEGIRTFEQGFCLGFHQAVI